MKYWGSGITLEHGTANAPAPTPVAAAPSGVPIPVTVAVHPANPANVVSLRYRVGVGAVRSTPARLIDHDIGAAIQYFEATLPAMPAGSKVRFVAVCECNGRVAPDRATIAKLPTAFAVLAGAAAIPRRPVPRATIATRAKPTSLAAARNQRRALETQLRNARLQHARAAQALSDRRRLYPRSDRTAASQLAQAQTHGRNIAESLKALRALSADLRGFKPRPDPNAPLAAVSDRFPVLLLPVRIETCFGSDAAGGPLLKVRIYPDQLTIDAHNDELTAQELADGQEWRTDAAGAGDAALAAWRRLATKHGSRRAAWIRNRMLQPVAPAALADAVQPPPRVFLLPDYFVITAYRDDVRVHQVLTQAVDDELAMLWDRQEAAGEDAELFDAGTRWMSDFDEACRVGMAVSISIAPADAAAGFTRITAVGVRASKTALEGAAEVEQFINHHHYTDGFAFIPPGVPTNNSAAESSAHADGEDADVGFALETAQEPRATAPGATPPMTARTQGERLAAALGIAIGTFDYIRDERDDDWSQATEMQQALWPATGEYVLQYMLGGKMPAAMRTALDEHFASFVRARGPLPLIRIGRQPYGVLPVSKLKGWVASAIPQDFPSRLHRVLMVLLEDWKRLAMNADLVPRIGGETEDLDEQLLAVLGMSAGTSELYTRPILDSRLVALGLPMFVRDILAGRSTADAIAAAREAMEAWEKAWDQARQPTLDQLKELAGAAGVGSFAPFVSCALMESFGWHKAYKVPLPLGGMLDQLYTHARARNPARGPVIDALRGQPVSLQSSLATDVLDLCSYRLDAWLTSLAFARLHAMRSKPEASRGLYVGAYGWVEDVHRRSPEDSAEATARAGGYIHAPSIAQAGTAAVLRNAFLTHQGPPGTENPFAVNLTSERVRRAMELMDGVRKGQALSVLAGYQFERGLHERGGDEYIADFRAAFPMVGNKETSANAGEAVEDMAARNVVDGVLLANHWRTARGVHTAPLTPYTLLPVNNASGKKISHAGVIRELEWLLDSLDAVGDVLLTEGVYQTVQGNYERAGAALDALAGTAPPADLQAVRTPLPGVSLEHRLCVLFGNDDKATTGPRAMAEGRLAGWLEELVGKPGEIQFGVTYLDALTKQRVSLALQRSDPEQPSTPTLADLGLNAIDVMYASATPPSGELTELERRIGFLAMSKAAVDPAEAIKIDFARPTPNGRGLGEAMEVARRALELIGSCQALTPELLVLPEQAHAGAALDSESYKELAYRVTQACTGLVFTAESVANKLAAQANDDRIDTVADPAIQTLASLLTQLSRYGIETAIPASPVLAAEHRARLDGAVAEARARVKKSRSLLDAAAAALTPPAQGDGEDDPPPSAAQCLSNAVGLACDAMKAVFGPSFVALPTFLLSSAAMPEIRQGFQMQHVAAGDADERILLWLQQAAQTHRGAARLEDLLLAAEAWRGATVDSAGELAPSDTGRKLRVAQLPHDPDVKWLALSDAERDSSDRPRGRVSIVSLHRAASLQAAVTEPERLCGLMVERWQETIPGRDVTTGLSFHFDRPNAIAGQSVLVAVPHAWNEATPDNWRLQDLVEIVRDTAELARVRMVDPDALRELDRLMPALYLPHDPAKPGYEREIVLPGIRQVAAQFKALT